MQEDVSQFGNWPRGKRNLADEIGAAWIVYTAVLASWTFVAGAGLASLTGPWPLWLAIALAGALGILYLLVLLLALGSERWGHVWGQRSSIPVSLANLAKNKDGFHGKRISTCGRIKREQAADGSRSCVLIDRENRVVLWPMVEECYVGRTVSVSGTFAHDEHDDSLIRFERIARKRGDDEPD